MLTTFLFRKTLAEVTLPPSATHGRLTPWVLSAVLWGAIGLMLIQTWGNYHAAEQQAYRHLSDTARQVERGVVDLFATNRSISNAIGEVVRRSRQLGGPCALACSDDLRAIRRLYNELTPGIELLLLDAQGRAVAETDPDLVSRLVGLPEIMHSFTERGAAQADVRFTRSLANAPALLISRAIRSSDGTLEAVAVLLEPLAVLDHVFDVPQLGPEHNVTLIDSRNTLLLRKPVPLSLNQGQTVPELDFSTPGPGPGSFMLRSTIDNTLRLTVRRDLPFALSTGSLSLLVGMSRNDYLGGWWRSTWIDLGLTVLLLGVWAWGLHALRKGWRAQAMLGAHAQVTRKVLMELPVPLTVVDRASSQLLRSNTAMIEMFGALAAEGQPMSRLFKSDAALQHWHDSALDTQVVELMTRSGPIHAELHRTDINDLEGHPQPCWLVVVVDISERYQREQRLQLEASTDTLTGLANRRCFALEAEQAVRLAHKSQRPLAVLALDLDHFKRVNDEHGHDAGDVVLSTVAQRFRASLREQDLAARMGGEEFAALLPDADAERALQVAERVRKAIEAAPVALPSGVTLAVTASLGVDFWQSGDEDIQAALKRADEALYQAKEGGRNRVMAGAAKPCGTAD